MPQMFDCEASYTQLLQARADPCTLKAALPCQAASRVRRAQSEAGEGMHVCRRK